MQYDTNSQLLGCPLEGRNKVSDKHGWRTNLLRSIFHITNWIILASFILILPIVSALAEDKKANEWTAFIKVQGGEPISPQQSFLDKSPRIFVYQNGQIIWRDLAVDVARSRTLIGAWRKGQLSSIQMSRLQNTIHQSKLWYLHAKSIGNAVQIGIRDKTKKKVFKLYGTEEFYDSNQTSIYIKELEKIYEIVTTTISKDYIKYIPNDIIVRFDPKSYAYDSEHPDLNPSSLAGKKIMWESHMKKLPSKKTDKIYTGKEAQLIIAMLEKSGVVTDGTRTMYAWWRPKFY